MKHNDHIDNVSENTSITSNARNWVAVLWFENIKPNWRDLLDAYLQNPYCYVVHDKDFDTTGEKRKEHVHLMVSFPNTTTYRHALSVFKQFSIDKDHPCCNTCYRVLNIRYMYNYLIHDTDTARKELKHLYDPSERICGLNFDIGLLEQISAIDKKTMARELSDIIVFEKICNYVDFYCMVMYRFDLSYFDIMTAYSGHFERLCKGMYLKSLISPLGGVSTTPV